MLIIGWAFTLIFTIEDINARNQLKSSENLFFKKSIEVFGKEISDNFLMVKYVIDPVLNEFKDSHGRNCLAINMGYQYLYYSTPAEYYMRLNELTSNYHGKIFKKLMKMLSGYTILGGADLMDYIGFYGMGICPNHSYVLSFENVNQTPCIEPKDDYNWISNEFKAPIESALIYSVFPKNLITLPSKFGDWINNKNLIPEIDF